MKTFVTLFNTENVHLTKDVGLIPYGMAKYRKYNSFCTVYGEKLLSNLDIVPELKTMQIKKVTGSFEIDAALFLARNAKKIAVLNVYHLILRSCMYIFIYKFFNNEGKIYWKMDGGDGSMTVDTIRRNIYKRALLKCDAISTEHIEFRDIFNTFWNLGNNKRFCYISNPFHPEMLCDFMPYCKRDNTIMTVGSIGLPIKSTDILLEAFRITCFYTKDWKLKLIGPIEKNVVDFQMYLNEWFEKYPEMKEKVVITGPISDRELLKKEYQSSKIFAFPSKSESFGIALMEAMLCGTCAIVSEIPGLRRTTNNYSNVYHFPLDDSKQLANQIMYAINHQEESEKKALCAQKDIQERCSLKTIAEAIDNELYR